MIEIISPYNPKASANIKINIIPTNIFGSIAFALTPESPTIPIAKPAAYYIVRFKLKFTNEERPQHRPDAKCL